MFTVSSVRLLNGAIGNRLLGSSVLTITTVTFSILIVVFSVTASQFSPRAVTRHPRDATLQHTMGFFVGTSLFCITGPVLVHRVETHRDLLGVIGAFAVVLLVGVLIALVRLIHHTWIAVQAQNLLARLHSDARSQLDAYLLDSEACEGPADDDEVRLQTDDTVDIAAGRTGCIQVVNWERLVALAPEHDFRAEAVACEGGFVAEHEVVFRVASERELSDDLRTQLRECVAVGSARSVANDPLLGVELFVEVALRALSPGIHDPYTAVSCVHYLGELLERVALRAFAPSVLLDERGTARVRRPRLTFEEICAAATRPIAQFGSAHWVVVDALLSRLRRLLERCPAGERREVLARLAAEVGAAALAHCPAVHTSDVERRIAACEDTAGGD